MSDELVKAIISIQDQMAKESDGRLGYISPKDAQWMRDINKNQEQYEMPHNHNDEPFPKEHNDKDFPYIDKELKTISETLGLNTPQGAIRHDQDKPHMDLLSPIATLGLAQVLTKGLEKYPGSQWKKGMVWSRVIASLLRHTFKFMAGEDYDEDTKLPHIDHMAANVMFLQEYFRKHKELDDRMKTGLE